MVTLFLVVQSWTLGPFTKPAGANPVVTPSASSRFRSPMNDSTVAWEEYATFNPAAVAKDGKVFLLYRAEDATGPRQIGAHTSRLGLAESSDGLRFTRRAEPVLYPDTDAQRQNEWPAASRIRASSRPTMACTCSLTRNGIATSHGSRSPHRAI